MQAGQADADRRGAGGCSASGGPRRAPNPHRSSADAAASSRQHPAAATSQPPSRTPDRRRPGWQRPAARRADRTGHAVHAPTPWSTPSVTESNGELQFTTPEEFRLAMSDADIQKVVQTDRGPAAARSRSRSGTPQAGGAPAPHRPKDEVAERALAHPEVQRSGNCSRRRRSARCEI